MLRSLDNKSPDAFDCNAVPASALGDGVAAGPVAFLSHFPLPQLPGNFALGELRLPPAADPVFPFRRPTQGVVCLAPESRVERLSVALGDPRLPTTLIPALTIAAPDSGRSASCANSPFPVCRGRAEPWE